MRTLSLFSDMFDTGAFDCVTGAAIYALILDHFGFDYSIKETDYHIYLLVNSENGPILFESTDPAGYIQDAARIASSISSYNDSEIQASIPSEISPVAAQSGSQQVSQTIRNDITTKQLAGLQYYNLAIDYFHKQNIMLAYISIKKAALLYPSERMESLDLAIQNLIKKDSNEP